MGVLIGQLPEVALEGGFASEPFVDDDSEGVLVAADRKSTRLNSSHSQISYAVFCLKKKTISVQWLASSEVNEQFTGISTAGMSPGAPRKSRPTYAVRLTTTSAVNLWHFDTHTRQST